MQAAARLAAGNINRALKRFQPDIVISVHPLAQELALHALAQRSTRTPFFTVVTDLAKIHPLWLHRQVDGCYVAAQEAHDAAIRAGLREEQIHVHGLPVRPAFEESYPPARQLKAKLGVENDLPLALLMGGGDGIGPVEAIAEAVAHALATDVGARGQLAVICGRNEALRDRLAARVWPVPVRVLGFVEAMPEWMNAADCLITKAGPGTIAEGMICGLPTILSGYIPGQEAGNIAFVVDNGAGVYTPEPSRIGQTVAAWFGAEADDRARMAVNARAQGRPHATREIVTSIVSLVDQ
jgi:1,2-diacylglycerol 3-beta-galactosyltransferase